MAGEAKRFELELQREWMEAQEDIADAVALVGLSAFASIVQKSPVGNPDLWKQPVAGYVGGRFRGNWNISIGAEDAATTENVDPDGDQTIARAEAVLSAYTADNGYPAINITNGLPYAVPLEEGHSKQAPNGMVALTITEIEARFDGWEV